MTNTAALPESIRRQVEEAEALEKQLYGQPAPEGNTEPTEPAPAPADTPTPVDEVVKQPTEVVTPDEETFRRRYEVLQGKYSAEVPRLHAQLRETTDALQELRTKLAVLEDRQMQQPKEQPKPDTDAETFGEDLTEAIDRRAKAQADALVDQKLKPLQDYIKQLEAKVGAVDQQVSVSAQDTFLNKLAAQVPDYEAVNADQGFLTWLGEIDPVYGLPRQAALDNAAQAMDSVRVAAIFNAYKQVTGKQVQQAQRENVRKELERQVTPQATASTAPQPTAGKIWSLDEYERALDPRNNYSMGREAANRLYEEAELALSEGRVR